MTREDTQRFLLSIQSLYPNWKPENKTATVNAWHWALEEYPAEAVMKALQRYVKTNNTGFAPSVSQIINCIYKPLENDIESEGMAWCLVKQAIQDGIYHAEERFSELPKLVQKAVGSPNMIRQWASTDSSEVNTVIMSNFQRNYRTIVERHRDDVRMDPSMKDLIEMVSNRMIGATPDDKWGDDE